MKKQYQILVADTAGQLSIDVEAGLNAGWSLAGGVAIDTLRRTWEGRDGPESDTVETYAQAMTFGL
jgi:hypothetical protein